MDVRAPAVAGTFYPADPAELEATVSSLLGAAAIEDPGPSPKALIVPHAGYIYSGPTAATAYAQLEPLRARVRRVVLLGPAHRVAVRGLAAPTCDALRTPLGDVPVAQSAIEALRDLPQVFASDRAHAPEHSLEVQLPFLQRVLGEFEVVPLVVGSATDSEVAEVLDRLWGGDETLIVISSDLSHYYDYATARRMDEATCAAIEELSPEAIGDEAACGRVPVRGLLRAARARGLSVRTLDLRSSGDTAGSRDQVVGYGAWALSAAPAGAARDTGSSDASAALPEDAELLALAREAIEYGLEFGRPPTIDLDAVPAALARQGACFVTLRSPDGALRGCIGTLEASRPLAADIAHNAFASAFRDPRVAPVSAAELPSLRIELSVLGPLEPVRASSAAELASLLRVGEDGLVLEDGGRRGTLLPQVWSEIPDPQEFVGAVWRKAGLPPTHWSPAVRAFRYGVRKIEPPPSAE